MALHHETAEDAQTDAWRQSKRGKGEAAFRGHLTVYLCMGLFLFTLNILTSPFDLWFYWPLFFWGWALVFQAVATYGAEAPTRVLADLRAIVPWLPKSPPPAAPAPVRAAGAAPFAAAAFASVHERIERLKEITGQIPEGPARDRALRMCAAADRIVATMAADRTDAATVGWFDSQLVEPTESLLRRYARLTSRGVAGADETLRRVEEHNLPLLESRFDALHDQLHRGEIIDLAVASEMLEFSPPTLPPAATRARA